MNKAKLGGFMKVWITGATGLAGRAVTKVLEQSHDVIPTGFSRTGGKVLKVDLTCEEDIKSFLEEHQPEAVIHLAAERKPDVCDNKQEQTKALNVAASESLARLCKEHNCWLLYFSTDYVFDGQNPPYYPDSNPNPLNFYGETKLAGEEVVKVEHPSSCILRVPVLYGFVESLDESAVTSIAKGLLKTEAVTTDHWATRFPTLVDDLGQVINKMLEKKPSGIYHFSGEEAMTKFEITKIMGDALGKSYEHVSGSESAPGGAPRPKDCQLDMTKLKDDGFYVKPTSIKSIIADILREHI